MFVQQAVGGEWGGGGSIDYISPVFLFLSLVLLSLGRAEKGKYVHTNERYQRGKYSLGVVNDVVNQGVRFRERTRS